MSLQASMDTTSPMWDFLTFLATNYRADNLTLYNGEGTIESPMGILGIIEGNDDYDGGGDFISVGFCLPDGIYVETEDGTYGQMQAFRIYKDPQWD